MEESFIHKDKEGEHFCLVFETLGKSLFDFIKDNKYKGMHDPDDLVAPWSRISQCLGLTLPGP